MADNIHVELIKRGRDPSQNKSGQFKTAKRENLKGPNCYLSTNWFFREMPNRTKVSEHGWCILVLAGSYTVSVAVSMDLVLTRTLLDSQLSFVNGGN